MNGVLKQLNCLIVLHGYECWYRIQNGINVLNLGHMAEPVLESLPSSRTRDGGTASPQTTLSPNDLRRKVSCFCVADVAAVSETAKTSASIELNSQALLRTDVGFTTATRNISCYRVNKRSCKSNATTKCDRQEGEIWTGTYLDLPFCPPLHVPPSVW